MTASSLPTPVDDASRWQGPAVVLARLDPKEGHRPRDSRVPRACRRLPTDGLVIAGDGEIAGYVRELARSPTMAGCRPNRIRGMGGRAPIVPVCSARAACLCCRPRRRTSGCRWSRRWRGHAGVVTAAVDLAARIDEERAGWVVSRPRRRCGSAGGVPANRGEWRVRGTRAALAEGFRWRDVGARLKALYAEMNSSGGPMTCAALPARCSMTIQTVRRRSRRPDGSGARAPRARTVPAS